MHFFLYNIILNFGAHVIHRITIFSSVACNWLPALSCCCISNFLCALSTLLYCIDDVIVVVVAVIEVENEEV